ncbi:proteasome-associated ECM29-like protein isoform X1 [Chlorella sorokiniana]|uniref:Proteasome-associated ECM29-like protein isoform X1 n=1 Tax=Chlorella sorokiniana TaxID=3076 RepID=A0A2P6TER4_CHLSO|nr:proteasome-associated ECM29-like protein isoform X1 [Chlorella sorokiniana]|eukprot:PRW21127.1 proteasome-associated ECM29-like protein isoform X1 [Chlorella sorokiniana]
MAAPAADEEVEGLSRVLTRLALTEDDKLEQVLSRLLPIVIGKLGPGASPAAQKKVLEILSHANKRTRALPTLRLPLRELAELYAAPGTAVMARSFAVVYLEQAVARAAPEERFAQLATLLAGLSTRPAQHQAMLLRMAAQCLEHMASGAASSASGSEQQFAAAYPFLQQPQQQQQQQQAGEGEAAGGERPPALEVGSTAAPAAAAAAATAAADRRLILQFALQLMLYQPPSAKGPSNPLQAGREPAPMEVDAPAAGPPAGMSRADVAAVEGKQAPAGDALLRQKLGFLNFSFAAGWDPTEMLPVYLAAACDPSEQVSRRGDELLKKRCGVDSHKPPVNLEDPAVVEPLFELFHGTADDESLPEEARRAPAGVALRARLLSLFCRSVAAANCFPHSLTTVTVCLYSPQTTPRLRQGGMEFAVWVFKHAAPEQLAPAAGSILDGLLQLLDDGAARGLDVTGLTLRGFTYQAVGQLAQRQPQAFAGRTDIAARFFSALATEPAGVRAAVQEATASLAAAFRGAQGDTAEALQQLLADSIAQQQPEPVRMAALQWAIKLFPFGHIPARYLCMLAAADPRFQISEAALEGLNPGKFAAAPGSGGSGSATGAGGSASGGRGAGGKGGSAALPAYPPFEAVLAYLQKAVPQLGRRPAEGGELPLPPKALLAAIAFLESCRRAAGGSSTTAGGGAMTAESAAAYLQLLENALLPAAPSELHAAALAATLSVAAAQRAAFAAAYAADPGRQAVLLRLSGHVDAAARQAAAQLLGLLVAPGTALPAQHAQQAQRAVALCEALLSTLRAGGPDGAKHAKQEALEGAAAAAGYVAANLLQGSLPLPEDMVPSLLQQLRLLLEAPASAAPAAATTTAGGSSLRAAAALALGIASLPFAPVGNSSGSAAAEPQQQLQRGLPDAAGVAAATASLLEDKDPKVAKKAAAALGYLCFGHSGQQPASAAAATAPAPTAELAAAAAEGAQPDSDAPAGAAGVAAAKVAGSGSDGVLQPSVAALLGLRTSKNEEVLFAVGEALCFCFGGVSVTPDTILHTPFASLAAWRQEQEEAAAVGAAGAAQQQQQQGGDAMEVEAPAAAGSTDGGSAGASGAYTVAGAAASPAQAAVQQQILGAVMEECLLNSRTEVRCAGAVWLVSLLLHCRRHPRLVPLLPEAQQALSQLLGDQNELTQEMASRGLAAVYDMADADTRQALLDSLMATLSGAPQKRRAVKLTEDSQLFEAGQLGAAPGGGGLTTYKELCSLATELNQPELVYRFMELANHQQAVNSSRGAAFGFASIARLAGEQLGPKLAAIIPRLYRYLYDPNGKVRDAMAHIWHALLDDPKAAVTQHFDAIMKALLADMGGGQWRVREAASLATADLLQGRRWEELAPHFEALWGMTLRVIDDIKESVRVAGVNLARTVRGLTLRLADRELTPPAQGRQAIAIALPLLLEKGACRSVGLPSVCLSVGLGSRQAIAIALPLLLEKGLPSQVPEVQALALDTTCKLAAAAGPELLRPHMVALVPAMLESLSGLEDSRLNYIEQHAERLGLDAGRLEGARVAASQGGLAGETLDLCARQIDVPTLTELAPKLGALVRRGVGLNTRAGAGRFITQVTRRLGSDVQPLAAQLIRALTEACRADRSAAVRRSYAAAAALLCRHAPAARVNRFVSDALALLAAEDASRDDRYVAGLLLRELGREAADVLASHASEVAPPAFMAQFDDESDVAVVWREVWEESTASSGAGLRLHMGEVVQRVTAGLQSGQWGRKKAAATALSQICQTSGDAIVPHLPAVLDALLKEVPGRIWEGKEAVLGAAGALASACGPSLAPPQRRRLVAALLDAASKKKAAFRKEGLSQLEKALLAFAGSGGAGEAAGSGSGSGGAASGAVSGMAAAAAAEDSGDFYAEVSPLLLELAGSFVEAAQGSASMETDQPQQGAAGTAGTAQHADQEPHPGKAVPAAQVAACLGAAFATAGPDTVRQQADAAAASLASLLGAAGKPADQLASVTAGCRVAERAAAVAGLQGPQAATTAVLSPQQAGTAALLQGALRLTEEGKAAQLREESYKLSGLLLTQLWPALPEEERASVLARLAEAEWREKLPAVQALAAQLAAQLRQLQ